MSKSRTPQTPPKNPNPPLFHLLPPQRRLRRGMANNALVLTKTLTTILRIQRFPGILRKKRKGKDLIRFTILHCVHCHHFKRLKKILPLLHLLLRQRNAPTRVAPHPFF